MRKLIVGLLVVGLSVVAHAEKVNLNIWGGYATVSMSDVNKWLDDIAKPIKDAGYTTSVSKLGSGMIFGGDVLYGVAPNISIGPRIAYLSATQGKVDASFEQAGYYVRTKMAVDASLIPIMFGGVYSTEMGENLSMSGGAFVGYGLASGKLAVKSETNVPNLPVQNFEIPSEGAGMVIDIGGAAGYKVAENISLGANLGYRIANISEMKATKDVPEAGVKKGDVMKDINNKAVPVDYSGLTIGIGIGIKF